MNLCRGKSNYITFKLSQKFSVHVDHVLGFLYHVAAQCVADISYDLAASSVLRITNRQLPHVAKPLRKSTFTADIQYKNLGEVCWT